MFSKKYIIQVDGMKCEHCSKRVSDELKKIEGIKSIKVDLNSKKVTISYKDKVDIDKIKHTILDLGYQIIEE